MSSTSCLRGAWRPLALCASLLMAGATAHAQQAQTMEERLRAQLRITTTQLQQAQNELAALKAGAPQGGGGAASATDSEALRKDLERTRAQLAAERQERERLSDRNQQGKQQAQAVAEKASAQVAQYRNAYDELLKLARAAEAERQRLTVEATSRNTAIARCEAKNAQLYAVGQEILHAYETVDIGAVMIARQPFAAQSRVKFEQIAQEYGDKLYEGRFSAAGEAQAAPAASASTDARAATGAPEAARP
ncbi:hypothetical protein [Cupriavidus sp.]|uniref:hypothetical protein n=1 Tax=Cupriavidus sp. TaxID=1873897 RepID=UPI003D0BCEB2